MLSMYNPPALPVPPDGTSLQPRTITQTRKKKLCASRGLADLPSHNPLDAPR